MPILKYFIMPNNQPREKILTAVASLLDLMLELTAPKQDIYASVDAKIDTLDAALRFVIVLYGLS